MVLATGMRADLRYRGIIGISGRLGDIADYPAAFGPAAKIKIIWLPMVTMIRCFHWKIPASKSNRCAMTMVLPWIGVSM